MKKYICLKIFNKIPKYKVYRNYLKKVRGAGAPPKSANEFGCLPMVGGGVD